MVVVVVTAKVVWCGALVEPPRQVAAGPLGLRSGKKKHNFLFYFPLIATGGATDGPRAKDVI